MVSFTTRGERAQRGRKWTERLVGAGCRLGREGPLASLASVLGSSARHPLRRHGLVMEPPTTHRVRPRRRSPANAHQAPTRRPAISPWATRDGQFVMLAFWVVPLVSLCAVRARLRSYPQRIKQDHGDARSRMRIKHQRGVQPCSLRFPDGGGRARQYATVWLRMRRPATIDAWPSQP